MLVIIVKVHKKFIIIHIIIIIEANRSSLVDGSDSRKGLVTGNGKIENCFSIWSVKMYRFVYIFREYIYQHFKTTSLHIKLYYLYASMAQAAINWTKKIHY